MTPKEAQEAVAALGDPNQFHLRKCKLRNPVPGTASFAASAAPSQLSTSSSTMFDALSSNTEYCPIASPVYALGFQFHAPITLHLVNPTTAGSHTAATPAPTSSSLLGDDESFTMSMFVESLPQYSPPFVEPEPVEFDFSQSSTRQPPTLSKYEKIHQMLLDLKLAKISHVDVLLQILNPDEKKQQYEPYRSHLYEVHNSALSSLLHMIMQDERGRLKLFECLWPHLVNYVCDLVSLEMESWWKDSFLSGIKAITPEFIDKLELDSDNGSKTPVLSSVLLAAAQTKRERGENKGKDPKTVCRVIERQLLYQSSTRCLGFPAVFGLFQWSTGCARQTIDTLHRCALSVGYDSVLSLGADLGDHCMEKAVEVAAKEHGLGYDNVNISSTIHVEQRGSTTPAKVQSGTFGILYGLRNAQRVHMLLPSIMKLRKSAPGLDFDRDIRFTIPQLRSMHQQLVVVIVCSLTAHIPGFESTQKHPILNHTPIRAIPVGYLLNII